MWHGSSDVPDSDIISEGYMSERKLIRYAAVETRRQDDEGEGSCQDIKIFELEKSRSVLDDISIIDFCMGDIFRVFRRSAVRAFYSILTGESTVYLTACPQVCRQISATAIPAGDPTLTSQSGSARCVVVVCLFRSPPTGWKSGSGIYAVCRREWPVIPTS